MAIQAVSGKAPITFTDSHGAQRSVPLSALAFNGSTIELSQAWTSASIFSAQDLQILLAMANAKVAAGELTPPPAVPPTPAIVFTAAMPGSEGNGITVTVTPDPGPLSSAKLLINAAERDTYPRLADATAAADKIGVDVASGGPGSPPAGTGLVTVKSGAATTPGLPKDGQTLPVKTATAVLAADGSTTLFTLVPRAGYTGPGVGVTVNLDPSGTTFTLTASYDAANTSTKVPELTGLVTLPPSVAFLVTAKPPPQGLGLPATGTTTITLSGGAPGIPATGIVFTS